MARPAMRREAAALNALINHNCFNSINDVFREAARAARSIKYLTIWLGYFHRDGGSSKGPQQAREVLARGYCRALR